MRRNLHFVLAIGMITVVSGIATAQTGNSATRDAYVISAKAGGVNQVEGNVTVTRKDGKTAPMIKNDQLEVGDKVATGADARAEILLNPGSFLRLGGNAGFEFVTTDLDDLKLKIEKGSAILEILASDEFTVSVALPNASLKFNRSGVFRIDILEDGAGRVSVWKGKMTLDGANEIGSGRSAVVRGNAANVAKFDRDNVDELDMWSKLRAKEIAAVNARVQRKSACGSMLSSYNSRAWNTYSSFGLWGFDPSRRMWSFVPFGYGWNSPYGFNNTFTMWDCDMPYWVYAPPMPMGGGTVSGTGGGNGGGSGGGSVPVDTARLERWRQIHTPPFQRTNPDGARSEGRSNPNSVPETNGNGGGRRNDDTYEPRGNFPRNNPNTESKPMNFPDSKPSAPSTPPIIVPPNPKTEKDNN